MIPMLGGVGSANNSGINGNAKTLNSNLLGTSSSNSQQQQQQQQVQSSQQSQAQPPPQQQPHPQSSTLKNSYTSGTSSVADVNLQSGSYKSIQAQQIASDYKGYQTQSSQPQSQQGQPMNTRDTSANAYYGLNQSPYGQPPFPYPIPQSLASQQQQQQQQQLNSRYLA